ncbi:MULTISPECIES: hypothetical protein [Halorussus]|uniref:DUF7344 domain-containing protein n=1 Tax=Halorussus TaxID=1070314 RepID=UPI000E21AD02|nr:MULTISPECIES: hypothetical protein [Halorussus]NHN57790.1 hypothetical protein [Halorussus sp. JP-T4]
MNTETRDSITQGTDATDLSPTAIFGLLADARRRRALRYLSRTVGATDLDDLAAELALREGEASASRRDRIRASLFHVHLPKLRDAGVVRYDAERGTVERRSRRDQLEPYLSLAAADEAR